jgi:hypothetical protein
MEKPDAVPSVQQYTHATPILSLRREEGARPQPLFRLVEKRLLPPGFFDMMRTPFAYKIRLLSVQDNPIPHQSFLSSHIKK